MAIPGNLSSSSPKVRETQWNSLWLKPALSTSYSKNEVKKTFRAEGFRKCLESKSVICFLLSVVYDVFLHLQYFIEEIKSCSGVLLLTQFFSFVSLICSFFGCITKHLMSGPSGN